MLSEVLNVIIYEMLAEAFFLSLRTLVFLKQKTHACSAIASRCDVMILKFCYIISHQLPMVITATIWIRTTIMPYPLKKPLEALLQK